MRRFSLVKLLAYVFLGLFGLVLFVLAIALSPVGVSTIVNIANDQAGVKIGEHSGSFYTSVKFAQVEYSNPQVQVLVANVDIDIGLNCLFLGQACLQNLAADTISVTQIPSLEELPPSEPITDYITLPVEIIVDEIRIKQFSFFVGNAESTETHQMLSVTNFLLSLNAKESVNIKKLSAGDINYYPLPQAPTTQEPNSKDIAQVLAQIAELEYSPITIPEVFVPLNLTVNQVSFKQICLRSDAPVCLLNTQAKLSVQKQKLKATVSFEPQKHLVSKGQIVMELDLANRFTHKVTATLTPNKPFTSSAAKPVTINVVGDIQQTQVAVSAQDDNGTLKILDMQAGLDLSSEILPVDIRLHSKQTAKWLNTWAPNVVIPLDQIDLQIIGDTKNYAISSQFELKATQTSAIIVDANVSLQDKKLIVKQLQSKGEIGNLLANLQIALTRVVSNTQSPITHALDINAGIDFSAINLQAIVPDLKSNLSGKVKLTGSYISKQINTSSQSNKANIQSNNTFKNELSGSLICDNIVGSIQGYNLALLCNAVIDKNGLVNIKSLQLRQGGQKTKSNTIIGKGKIVLPQGLNENALQADFTSTKSDFALNVNLQDLSYLYPKLVGNISGDVIIAGGIDKPRIKADLNISNVVLDRTALEAANVNLSVDAAKNWKTNLKINARNIRIEQQSVQTIDVSLDGNMQEHQLNIALVHPEMSLRHSLSGTLSIAENKATADKTANQWVWQGLWEKGEWTLPFDVIALKDPIKIKATPNSIRLSAHCWLVSNTQKDGLCMSELAFKDQNLRAEAKLNYNVNSVLRYYLSDIVQPGTHIPLASDISVTYADKTGLTATAYTLITEGKVVTSRHNIALMAIVANIELEKDTLYTNIFAGTKDFGSLGLRSQIILKPENRQHEGQLSINQIQLSPLLRFIPSVEKIAGIINGNLKYSGPLDLPLVNGEMNISKGELVVVNYPYPITNFNQSIVVQDNLAKVAGEFELGSGAGEYNADIKFANGLSVVGKLKGAGIQLAYGDNELLATPDLAFDVTPDNIKLSGQISIPNALFKLDKLPESARSPSSDTIIIGAPAPEPIIPMGLNVNIRLIIDAPKLKRVNIDALDLKASLAGDLRLQVKQEKNEQTGNFSPLQTYLNGTINILQGKYEAYGQVLQIRSGDIYFSGLPSLPQFDIAAIRNPLNTADNVIAGVRISGNPIIPKVELFSEPSMIQARQLSYLLQGTDLGGSGDTDKDVLLVNMLVGFGVGGSENRVNKLGKSLGFDSLNIRTAGQGTGTQLQVTGRIADNIQVTYGVGLFDSASEVILKYQLLPKLYLEAKSGANSALDLFYEVSRKE